jgi:hypothetical protein
MGTAGRSRAWSLKCEVENPQLLGEFGSNQPTSIDALLTSSTEVITVESKFDRDAKEGLGTCSQFKKGLCEGYFGPGSDNSLSGDTPWCRLERWDGSRSPRYYWALGKSFFRPEIFRMQHLGEQCPFSDGNYQLMRNFLFAAAFAEIQHKNRFGVLVICPSSRSNLLIDQVECFKKKILLKSYADRVAICTYETYIDILRQQKSSEAHQLADFLVERISSILKG